MSAPRQSPKWAVPVIVIGATVLLIAALVRGIYGEFDAANIVLGLLALAVAALAITRAGRS